MMRLRPPRPRDALRPAGAQPCSRPRSRFPRSQPCALPFRSGRVLFGRELSRLSSRRTVLGVVRRCESFRGLRVAAVAIRFRPAWPRDGLGATKRSRTAASVHRRGVLSISPDGAPRTYAGRAVGVQPGAQPERGFRLGARLSDARGVLRRRSDVAKLTTNPCIPACGTRSTAVRRDPAVASRPCRRTSPG